jgi:hypothetical protein
VVVEDEGGMGAMEDDVLVLESVEVEPLIEPLDEAGGVVTDVLPLGVVVVVVVELVVLAPLPALLRSQPVAAAVARARTATTESRRFMFGSPNRRIRE